jgi:type IV secretory pathway ATPase VirB11/archaellum biosynthesis ATPase
MTSWESVRAALSTGRGEAGEATTCSCEPAFERRVDDRVGEEFVLSLDAERCPGDGDLVASPACRATAIGELADRDAALVRTVAGGRERAYEDEAAALLLAAGRFVERATVHDPDLAARARRDPLAAAREATGRAGPISRVAAETGLAETAARADDYADALRPYVGPTIAKSRVSRVPPADAELLDVRELSTGAAARRYRRDGRRHYHLRPAEADLDADELAVLAAAHRALADGRIDGGDRAPSRAIRAVVAGTDSTAALPDPSATGPVSVLDAVVSSADAAWSRTIADASGPDDRRSDSVDGVSNPCDGGSSQDAGESNLDDATPSMQGSLAVDVPAPETLPIETLTAVLRKHTRGLGILTDLFADPRVSDVFATGPIPENPLRVTLDGRRHRTNVKLTPAGAAALSSRLRRCSGRSFSRASPTIDATLEGVDATVRVAGVTDPAGDGRGFAFRRHDEDAWTLPALVRNRTLPADAAALLSVAVERGTAVLLAGPRGAGKTTALGALLWELPPDSRTVVVEDTPELPLDSLRATGRDVQPLRTDPGDGPAPTPASALRTALRLGDGALVLGEVRGEEAQVLYEAMRVGDGDEAVLGTIHGSGGDAVRERVVADLGVPESSFAATDLLVTLAADPHRVVRIEEVRSRTDGTSFRDLYAIENGDLVATGVLDRGNSELVADLAAADEPYAAVLETVADRAEWIASLATSGRTSPADVESDRPDIERSEADGV